MSIAKVNTLVLKGSFKIAGIGAPYNWLQKFIILEVYIYPDIKYWGACDVFRVKSIFRTNFGREKMTCDLFQTISLVHYAICS